MRKALPKSLTTSVITAITMVAGTPQALATHAWGNYHWARTNNPFTLKLGDNLSAGWKPFLATTSSDWSQSTVLDTVVVPGQAKSNCRPTAGRVEVCNKSYGQNGWLGIAQIWASGDHITQGTVKLNDTYFSMPQYNTAAWKNLVMCQEVGHTFGLDHQDENTTNPNLGTCMDYTNDPSTNQHPNAHDYEMLQTIYAHLDSTTTILSGTSANKHADTAEEESWGKQVHSSGNGKLTVHERELPHGEKLITFVVWAQ